ncbi:ras-related protein RHN1 [Daphnia magna]|uniref:Putative Ras-related protein RabJ n=1 Tax=Daphnia magna TaxID=35525 RepID=A0A0P5VJY2_9CRUS|nr:ras-related protein RHN1 [Daphnia magna]KZS03863.1 putative Ras-related protein RabJ [Daphnia magna]
MEENMVVNNNIEAKIVILGEQNVGKTSFVVVFNPERRNEDRNKLSCVSSTIGASFVSCRVRVKDKSVRMQIWDTAGQERFKSMVPLYYRKANAAVVMYDVSAVSSFKAAQLWVKELKRNVETPVLILLVGNKADLCDQRVISYEQGYEYASMVGALFCETSAITDKGVTHAFGLLAKSLIEYEREHSNFQYKFKADYVNLHEMNGSPSSDEHFSMSCC